MPPPEHTPLHTQPPNTLTITYMRQSRLPTIAHSRVKELVPAICLSVRGRLVIREEKSLPFPMPGPIFSLATGPAGTDVVRGIKGMLTLAVAEMGEFWYKAFIEALQRKSGWVVSPGVAGDLAVLFEHVE
ncbi:hypothetical protein BJX64DRAFT_289769 [Aspergillus heterothallicus]